MQNKEGGRRQFIIILKILYVILGIGYTLAGIVEV